MIYRIDVFAAGGASDGEGESVRQQAAGLGVKLGPVQVRRVFLIDTEAGEAEVRRVADELLADPVVERAEVMRRGNLPAADAAGRSRIEVHPKPGVMDPVAASTEMAIRDMGIAVNEVRTGRAYVIEGEVPRADLERLATRALANPVIDAIHFEPFVPERFPRGQEGALVVRHVKVRGLSDAELTKLSREGHLFLSLAEMKAIQAYFEAAGREPTDAELETLAQTWSEHCVHKTLKSAVDLEVRDERGAVIEVRRYDNLIRQTIFQSTMDLIEKGGKKDFCLSVFVDNAGVIAFDEQDAVCFKVETHNRPSAIDPYGGSATGIGGVIRDVLGTGLGARPVANTDVFCVADPRFGESDGGGDASDEATERRSDEGQEAGSSSPSSLRRSVAPSLPRGVIHPRRILQQVVAGVRDYGNRMGIPTVNGAVYFDERYVANPLVFCGCVGLIPRSRIRKEARAGDAIVLIGGRTGRDGIHGATFSSAELTSTHADEFSHAVQIGNAITEKKMTDVVLQAADRGLFNAITDCGAGGLSSAVGEMGEKLGAAVRLETVPLKYAGLRYDEIWISEAQERMVLAVPPGKVDELLALAASEDVEATVIGTFGTERAELVLTYQGTEVGRMAMAFVHKGIPMPRRRAVVVKRDVTTPQASSLGDALEGKRNLKEKLLAALSHPNVASKHWIVRQYDHEVQGGSVVKPLTGPRQVGPSDASVIRPKLTSRRGVALGCGLAPHVADPYRMAVWAIDEAIRNVVCVGADPNRTAILDNFCWPGTHDELSMGSLARTCEACRDAALAYGVPFISGKDSLHNQFTDQESGRVIRIPDTLLVSAIAVVEDVRKCVTMDLKGGRESRLCLVGAAGEDLASLAKVHRAVAELIRRGEVLSCHDVSDGGYLTAAAEMCIASGLGVEIAPDAPEASFAEGPGRYLVEMEQMSAAAAEAWLTRQGLMFRVLGSVTATPSFDVVDKGSKSARYECQAFVDDLTRAWRGTLDW